MDFIAVYLAADKWLTIVSIFIWIRVPAVGAFYAVKKDFPT
jgi:hypothetical protein